MCNKLILVRENLFTSKLSAGAIGLYYTMKTYKTTNIDDLVTELDDKTTLLQYVDELIESGFLKKENEKIIMIELYLWVC